MPVPLPKLVPAVVPVGLALAGGESVLVQLLVLLVVEGGAARGVAQQCSTSTRSSHGPTGKGGERLEIATLRFRHN